MISLSRSLSLALSLALSLSLFLSLSLSLPRSLARSLAMRALVPAYTDGDVARSILCAARGAGCRQRLPAGDELCAEAWSGSSVSSAPASARLCGSFAQAQRPSHHSVEEHRSAAMTSSRIITSSSSTSSTRRPRANTVRQLDVASLRLPSPRPLALAPVALPRGILELPSSLERRRGRRRTRTRMGDRVV